jgi:hypothetical protein
MPKEIEANSQRKPQFGSTGRTRYVKITSLEETKQPALREWMKQAERTPGWT